MKSNSASRKVIIYKRISTEGQSNFSIDAQHAVIIDYCERQNFEVIGDFTDGDGQSGFSFNRKEWKALEKAIYKHRKELYAILVARYNRFSRNAGKALSLIEKIEGKYQVLILSAGEPIFVEPSNPYFFEARANMLVRAESEWRMIKYQTNEGNWRAKSSGRTINRAPWGYRNVRDEDNKPNIELIQELKPLVRQIAMDFYHGLTPVQIKNRAKEKGFPLSGKSAIMRILKNPTYAGLVKVPAFRHHPERMVKGDFEACYPEQVYWANILKLEEQGEQVKQIENAHLELRGFIACKGCGNRLTGSKSRSKTGKYYYYYFCNNCKGGVFRADKARASMSQLLTAFCLSDRHIDYLRKSISEKLDDQIRIATHQEKGIKNTLEGLEVKIDKLEEKYILGEISQEFYEKWRSRYAQDWRINELKLNSLESQRVDLFENIENSWESLGKIEPIYTKASVTNKQLLLSKLFPGGLYLGKNLFYTRWNPCLHDLIKNNKLYIRNLEVWKQEELPQKLQQLPLGTRSGT